MAQANILDAILNEPRHAARTSSAHLGDKLMDLNLSRPYRQTGARDRVAADGLDSLAEAASVVDQTQHSTQVLASIEEAVKFARLLPKHAQTMPAATRQKIASVANPASAAINRLIRLQNKTAQERRQDGAVKLADYLDPEMVPLWAKQARADMRLLNALYRVAQQDGVEILPKKVTCEQEIKKREMSDEEVAGYVKKLLTDGMTAKDAESKLTKMAELQLFNKSFAYDKLDQASSQAGIDFMKPNTYMENAPATYERQPVKLGSAQPATQYSFTGVQDLKTRDQVHRWAGAMIDQARRENARPKVQIKQAAEASSDSRSGFARVDQQTAIRSNSTKVAKTAAPMTFTAADALKLHNTGMDLSSIYRQASMKVGSANADHAMRQFIAGLKGTKTRVALTQIDCTLLPQKLGSSNGIIGAKKCATCTYRSGMSCGLTGGTLLTYPGMKTTTPTHRTASNAARDGYGLLNEFEMLAPARSRDIDMKRPGSLDVELTAASRVDLS